MSPQFLQRLAKFLEGLGLLIILVGLMMSVEMGMRDEGLSSMRAETYGLAAGGVLFAIGWLLERALGSRD
ncbi:MAG TPA: hypothetical protein EYQ25_03240 [Planctomycetes bacterium]|nr:hypothetical protein [Planctomycetota bacterium]HIL38042.1 hypothetical protein [Planctomycetota bacterium]